MIDHEYKEAIPLLYEKGMGIREIARRLQLSRNTVKKYILPQSKDLSRSRSDKILLDSDLIKEVYEQCNGWKQRVHEIVTDRGIKIAYSTLTQKMREMNLDGDNERCSFVEDEPGKEMQNDTSPYILKFDGKSRKVTGCLLYFRYSKHRYLKFYQSFDRFRMRCFFYEALMFFGYTAEVCIIDNTSLAVIGGSGPTAIMSEEMSRFSKQFGFRWIAHHLNHSNRKAGNERSFWTGETNFFPGRKFKSMKDLNDQAFEWSTKIMASRPLTKKRIIPINVFEEEKAFLRKIPSFLPRPYRVHDRGTDQYGYAAFNSNFYWVPGKGRHDVKILEYSDRIKIFSNRKEIAEYDLPEEEVKNKRFPEKCPLLNTPNNQIRSTKDEEKKLRDVGSSISDYLDFAILRIARRYQFIRKLHAICNATPKEVFIKSIARCLKYRVTDLETIERIILYNARAAALDLPLPQTDQEYEHRESYKEGSHSEKPDLTKYDKISSVKEK